MRTVSWLPGSYHFGGFIPVRYVMIGGHAPFVSAIFASGPHSSTTRRIHWQGVIFSMVVVWGLFDTTKNGMCFLRYEIICRKTGKNMYWYLYFVVLIICCCGGRQIGCFQWPSPTLFKCLGVPVPRIEFSGSITWDLKPPNQQKGLRFGGFFNSMGIHSDKFRGSNFWATFDRNLYALPIQVVVQHFP